MSEIIKEAVNKFLCWKLPADFRPDAGIRFEPMSADGTRRFWEPTGTNLFDAKQATNMFDHCIGAELGRLTAENEELKTALSGRTYFHDNAEVERQNKVMREALERSYETMKHAYIFVKSREKIADVGLDLYLETMTKVSEAIKEVKG